MNHSKFKLQHIQTKLRESGAINNINSGLVIEKREFYGEIESIKGLGVYVIGRDCRFNFEGISEILENLSYESKQDKFILTELEVRVDETNKLEKILFFDCHDDFTVGEKLKFNEKVKQISNGKFKLTQKAYDYIHSETEAESKIIYRK